MSDPVTYIDTYLQQQRDRLASGAVVGDLKQGVGGGTSGGMDDWKASVDRQLGTLHSDIRNLLYGLIGAALLSMGAVGGLYVYAGNKADGLQAQISNLQTGQAKAEGESRTRDAITNGKIDVLLERTKT